MDSNSVYFLYHSITWVSSSIFKRTPQLWITICIPRFKRACRLTRLCQHAPGRYISLCPDLGTQQHGPHACVQHWVHVDEFITINTDYFCEDDSILYLPAHIKMNLWLIDWLLHEHCASWTRNRYSPQCHNILNWRQSRVYVSGIVTLSGHQATTSIPVPGRDCECSRRTHTRIQTQSHRQSNKFRI